MAKVKKVEGKKIKVYKGCPIYLYNNIYQVYYKGQSFDCKNLKFAETLIDEFKPKRKG